MSSRKKYKISNRLKDLLFLALRVITKNKCLGGVDVFGEEQAIAKFSYKIFSFDNL